MPEFLHYYINPWSNLYFRNTTSSINLFEKLRTQHSKGFYTKASVEILRNDTLISSIIHECKRAV